MNQSRVTASEQNILLFPQEIPRDVGTLCQEQGQRPNIRTKDAPSALITWEITKVLEALCQEPGAGIYLYFCLLSHTCPPSFAPFFC